jgi:hypothetical protein
MALLVTALPLAGGTFGGRHATGLRHDQAGKIELAEARVEQQAVEQRVHRRQHVERPLLEHFHKLGNVARVGNERHERALAHGQQAQGEREDVVQR